MPGRTIAQAPDYKFIRFDNKKGLSHNQVNCFLKDWQGFLWIGTPAGLNRFDGSAFKVYRGSRVDTNSLANDYVHYLFEDPAGCLWVSDRERFCIFNPVTEQFSRDADAQARKFGLPDASITRILKSRTGDFWICHRRLGMCRFDVNTQRLIRYHTASLPVPVADFKEDGNGLLWMIYRDGTLECLDPAGRKIVFKSDYLHQPGQYDYNLLVDSDNDVWIFSEDLKGGYLFHTRAKRFQAFHTNTPGYRLGSDIIRAITQDKDGIIWVATDHGGITLIDKRRNSVRHLVHDPSDVHSISQNSAISIYSDAAGSVWVGTFKKGFNHYHSSIFRFPHFRSVPGDPSSLPAEDVNAIVEDARGNLWIGANGGGLIYFDRQNRRFTHYKHDPGDPNSLSNDVIVSLFIDHEQKLWVGTYFGGLNCFDGRSFKRFLHNPADPNSLSDNRVWTILEDSGHNLWVGTLRGGLSLYDRKRQTFRHFRPGGPNSICSNYISALKEDRNGALWIGTERGVDVLDVKTGRFLHFENTPTDTNSLSHNTVTQIAEDPAGNIWIATLHGLNLFDRSANTFRSFGRAEGLPDEVIMSLAADPVSGLWMGTPNGIANLLPDDWKNPRQQQIRVRHYNESDGLQAREFNHGAVCLTRKGEAVFGGPNGFNVIDPKRIDAAPAPEKLLLTDLQLFNRDVRPGEKVKDKAILKSALSDTRELTLPYHFNVFSIGFTALNFFHPEKDEYFYQLEGFNNCWLPADKSRKAAYTNLDPGEYTFRVRVKNETGNWQESAPLKIRITPPFWQTGLAKALYAVLFILALALARWIMLDRERMKFSIEQERWQAQRTHELDLLKIKFLTNISHEFRTPLSLILTPVESLLQNAKNPDEKKQLALVLRNAKRLLNLVNQLLDFKSLEVAETRYRPVEGDIVAFIRDLVHSFTDISSKKDIRLSFESNVERLMMPFDPEKMSRLIFNLLSNAFKFTPGNGQVEVRLDLQPASGSAARVLEISVSDTGIGIPPEAREKIFQRFYQHELPDSMLNHGSGIGLAITREFVRLHGGTIRVQTQEKPGSTFVICLPVVSSVQVREHTEKVPAMAPAPSRQSPPKPQLLPDETAAAKPRILVVEDDSDFRFYLREALKSQFDILEASDGAAAKDIAFTQAPDLIVSDIVMPLLSGLELCRELKSAGPTAHIPVILLTAHSASEQELLGYEQGADAYLIKPFSFSLLSARIQNLIQQRRKLQQSKRRHIDIQPSTIAIIPLDEQLIQKAVEIVEQNVANADFSVEELSHALAMSRVYLYKRLLALTGKSPIEFIRIIRLKRAAQLLEKSQLTVAEVAYKVGFNNPKYFARYFKEEFGVLPKSYQKKSKSPQLPAENTAKEE